MRTIESRWQEFQAATLPANASQAQRADMRMSFIAGVAALFTAQREMAAMSNPEAYAAFNALDAEVTTAMKAEGDRCFAEMLQPGITQERKLILPNR